jgi:hypothetical protein
MRYFYRPGHPKASDLGFVSDEDLAEIPMDPPKALFAPVMVDRFYENTKATDGTDIGSRAKHREYMKRNNLAPADDFSGVWANAAKEREKIQTGQIDQRERRDLIGRALYERHKP